MENLTFLGDVWLPRPFTSNVIGNNPFVLNLESPITRSLLKQPGKICLKTEQNFIRETFGSNPIAVCLANNHIMDYGAVGLADTLSELQKSDIRYFGAGRLEDNCNNPLLLSIGDRIIALLGYVCPSANPIYATIHRPGVMPPLLSKITEDIVQAKIAGAQYVIVNMHWGVEETHLPRPQDIEFAHSLIACGAEAIVGHHSHCIQAIESYTGKLIYYGLGNCLFPDVLATIEGDVPTVSKKRQQIWNNRSLMVTFNPTTARFNHSELCFRSGKLIFANRHGNKPVSHALLSEQYPKKFKRHVCWCNLRAAIGQYLSAPKLLRWRHIRSFIHILRNGGDAD